MIVHIPTKKKYANRKDAKEDMGHYNYNRALKNGELINVITHDVNDIIIK